MQGFFYDKMAHRQDGAMDCDRGPRIKGKGKQKGVVERWSGQRSLEIVLISEGAKIFLSLLGK